MPSETIERARVAKKPSDAEIIAAINSWGSDAMTYVIRNRLVSKGYRVETPWVLRNLKRMEKAGAVERAYSPYITQLCWKQSPPSEHRP